MQARSLGRQLAMQYLFMLERAPEGAAEPLHRFARLVRAAEPADAAATVDEAQFAAALAFAEGLVRGVAAEREALDRDLAAALKHYALARVAAVERAILRLCVYELRHGDADRAVVLNEAVELAKRFGGPDSSAFINGVAEAVGAGSA